MSGKRIDANHGACRDNLRATGWFVKDTSFVGDGFFDLIAAKAGRVVFIEVKDGSLPPSRRQLTPAEAKLHAEFRAVGMDVYVMEDAFDLSYFNRPRRDSRSYDDRQLGTAP